MNDLQTSNQSASTAVIIVDHGSRRAESNELLLRIVAEFSQQAPFEIIEAAHMELAEPSIETAFAACVRQGATRVVVYPYFLLPGNHWSQDIPALTAAAAAKHQDVPYLVAAPLGPHPLMSTIIMDRIDQCLEHAGDRAEACAMCAGTRHCAWKSQ